MTQIQTQPANGARPIQRFDPMAPVQSVGALKALMDQQREGLAQMLPRHITPERLFKTMLVAVNRTPKLLQCTGSSVLETINRAAELGLDLSGTLGEAYPVPFNTKIKINGREEYRDVCQLIIGYRGMEKLAWQSGEVESIDAEVVHTNDRFVFKKGFDIIVEFEPNLTDDPGAMVGAYACVKLRNGGRLARFLTKNEIEKIRNSAKSKDSPAWRSWYSEMARKCALKRVLKDAPLSTEKFVRALETDEEDFTEDVYEAETVKPRSRTSALLDKVRQPEPQPEPVTEPAGVGAEPAPQEQTEAADAHQLPPYVRTDQDPQPAQPAINPPGLALLTHQQLMNRLEEIAQERKQPPAVVNAFMDAYGKQYQIKSWTKLFPKGRQAVVDAFLDAIRKDEATA